MEKKVRVKKSALPVSAEAVAGWTPAQLNDYFEKEGQTAAADKLQEDTNEAKNALEAYIYDLRNKLYESLGAYVQEVRLWGLTGGGGWLLGWGPCKILYSR
jgi:heat shock protein 4